MKEYRQIAEMWKTGEASAFITLVRTEGSSYRRPGARLLIGPGNEYAGTISGGCLEAEVVRKASWFVRQGAVVERYSTMFDDTAEIPFGLGCGGVVDLLIEPTATPECREMVNAIEQAIAGEESIVLTWLPDGKNGLARAVLSPEGDLLFASQCLTEAVLTYAKACVLHGLQALPPRVFAERLVAPQRLYVLGAGDDAKPIVSMAALLGWTIKVMDRRAQLARAERFPEADSVSVVGSDAAIQLRQIRPTDAVVFMTHSYEQDRDLLAAVLPLRPRYLGMLGARHRTSLLVTEVAERLGWSVAECCEHIQAPVGLNLGGDGSEVIALAVVAEIQAYRTGQLANSRKLSASDVATYVSEGGGSSKYQQVRCAVHAL